MTATLRPDAPGNRRNCRARRKSHHVRVVPRAGLGPARDAAATPSTSAPSSRGCRRAPAVRGGGGERRRDGHGAGTTSVASRSVGDTAAGERTPPPPPRREPSRLRPDRGPRVRRREGARGDAAHEAAQHQRDPHQPLPPPGAARPRGRAGLLGHRRVRPRDAPTASRRTAGSATPPTTPTGARSTSTAPTAWSSATRTIPASSRGRSGTSPGRGATWPRWPRGSVGATRGVRCTTRTTTPTGTST